MEKNASTIFRELKDDVAALVELKFDLLKLNAYEKVGTVVSVLSFGLMLVILAFGVFLFLFLALSFYLESLLEVEGCGFLLVSCLYLLLMVFLVLCRRQIRLRILNEVVEALITNEVKNDDPKNTDVPEADALGNAEQRAGETEELVCCAGEKA